MAGVAGMAADGAAAVGEGAVVAGAAAAVEDTATVNAARTTDPRIQTEGERKARGLGFSVATFAHARNKSA
jgi:hypothetical protein